MKYSTIIVAAFAAGAMARAIPDDSDNKSTENYDDSKKDASYDDSKKDTPSYDNKKDTPSYDNKKDTPSYDNKKDTPSYDNKKDTPSYDNKKDNSYGGKDNSNSGYKVEYPKAKDNTCVPQKTYEQNKDNKHYGPTPYQDNDEEYKKYEQNSCFEDLSWKKDIYADDDCELQYKPKEKSYKKPVNVYVYGCDDYAKPIEKCGSDHDNSGKVSWKPSKSFVPSDCKEGKMYRFKICDAEDETKYTWSAETPIYNPHYYAEKPAEKPVAEKCPPPTVPVYPVSAPAAPAPAAPVEAATAPADAAPASAAPAPAAPVEAAPAAPATNATAESPEAFTSGSSAIKTSVSFMVGIAALVTFAL